MGMAGIKPAMGPCLIGTVWRFRSTLSTRPENAMGFFRLDSPFAGWLAPEDVAPNRATTIAQRQRRTVARCIAISSAANGCAPSKYMQAGEAGHGQPRRS